MFIPIDDAADPRLEAYREMRDRDRLSRQDGRPGTFVAEGEVVLRVLLSARSRFRTLSVLIAHNRVEALGDVLPGPASDVPVYVAPSDLLARVVGFPIHRGVLAIGARRAVDEPAPLPAVGPSLVLGLVGLANHDNVGGAFRNAAAFGADAVLLDGTSCDPLYRKAIRVSVGATLMVPFRRGGPAGAMADALLAAGYTVFGLTPGGREVLTEVAWPGRAALLVGAEGAGLPPCLLNRVRSVRIAMAPGFDSLNVATAAGIALHAAAGMERD
jgi:tRNA G18 (ribose-2'-O)-methylase SpoU